MPSLGSQSNRFSFISAGQAGLSHPVGPRACATSRGLNDALIRTARSPQVRPRFMSLASGVGGASQSGLSFSTNAADFGQGVIEGLVESLKSAWSLVSHDMWQAKMYSELATTVTALGFLTPLNLPVGLAAAQSFDWVWGTRVAQRQIEILRAINQLILDIPRWTFRQWGHAVGRLIGDAVLAKGSGAAVKLGASVAVNETVHLQSITASLQKLGTISEGAGNLAKARAVVPVYSRFTLVRTAVPFIDVSTETNGASFWSGLKGLNAEGSAVNHAKAIAEASGRKTLEMTKGGAWLDRQTALFDKRLLKETEFWEKQMSPQWAKLSSRFAAKAKGTVAMYKGSRYRGAKSIWEQSERSILEESREAGRVTDIRVIVMP